MIRAFHSWRSRSPLAPVLAAFVLLASGAQAQTQAPAGLEAERAERSRQLESLLGQLERARQTEAKLRSEIDAIKDDRKKLAQALLDSAARLRAIETKVSAGEKRLPELDQRERELQRSLDGRRDLLAEVLAALQRIGRQPAPALVLRSEDALDAVRSAILLGAVIPGLRGEVDTLAADLGELARLRSEIATERDNLVRDRIALEEERMRIAALGEERRKRQAEGEKALESERARAQLLAKQVETVTELVARIEQEIESAAKAAEAARRESDARAARAAIGDPTRIAPALPFAEAKGRLPLPVAGTRVREFGAPDGLGGTEKGLLIAARPDAQVTAPCDGWVVYAGTFRSYGQLLIINPGGGYHVLLAGMERITVELGQFVVTGEPVAVMGNGPRTASAVTLGSSQPILHVEFRKDGNSIDSAPWWAKPGTEKARG
jgi:septal ring factor EnvC (AmiA/AmiB activator)